MKRELVISLGLVAGVVSADVTPSGIFSDNMVLQHGKPVPVWGKAEPGEKVSVSFAAQTLETAADAKGDWSVTLKPLEVCKEARTLVLRGKNEISFGNVLVGDVWLVSGQSNAEMTFRWGVVNGNAEMARAKEFPNIRATKFRHETSPYPVKFGTCNSPWVVCDDKSLTGVTAMGYFFAREINSRTGMPIGLLDDNWSGCRIEPFICAEGLKHAAEMDAEAKAAAEYLKKVEDWKTHFREQSDPTDYAPGSFGFTFAGQHNAMVEPIVRFPIAGALWYQGCSNGGEDRSYLHKLEALIGGWREKWGYEFPFYIVQLASYTKKTEDAEGGNGYAKIRDAMRVAAQTIPRTGLAVTIDIGNANDIHPKNKFDVGARLARWARRDVYDEKDLVVSGPLYKSMKIEGGKIRLRFDHVGKGLMAAEKGPDTPGEMPKPVLGALRGFAIAGADRRWQWAEAEIDGDEVVVSSELVSAPVAVRYAHRANPMGDCNLYNEDGLPASPFRTDDWK